jgi:hypothetical protein
MNAATELLKAIAALITAVAWPAIVLYFLLRYRTELSTGLTALAGRLAQAKSFEFGPLKVAMAESATVAMQLPTDPTAIDQQRAIQEQWRIGQALRAQMDPSMLPEIRKQLDNLARQYEVMRAERDLQKRQATDAEIVEMNKLVAQMRALAVACAPYWEEYARSDRPGDRLGAVIISQMSPDPSKLDWLGERFEKDRPFIFYHAALALQNMVDQCWTVAKDEIKRTAEKALQQVQSYAAGTPDLKTVQILQNILARK